MFLLRLIWSWTCHRSISTIQGRPFSIGDDFWDVNLPSEDRSEGTFINEIISSDMSHDFEYMNYSIHLFKMSQLVSNIKSVFYRLSRPSGGNPWPKNLLAIQNQVHRLGAMGIKRVICCALRTGRTKTSAYNKAKNTLSWSNVPLTSIIASNCSAKWPSLENMLRQCCRTSSTIWDAVWDWEPGTFVADSSRPWLELLSCSACGYLQLFGKQCHSLLLPASAGGARAC